MAKRSFILGRPVRLKDIQRTAGASGEVLAV